MLRTLALLSLAGCLYTDEINHAPVARISSSGSFLVGSTMTFSAGSSHDADGGQLTYAWKITRQEGGGAQVVVAASNASSLTVVIEFKTRYQVELVVTDDLGAATTSQLSLEPMNRPPSVTLQNTSGPPNPSGCYTVGKTLTFAAEASDLDRDQLAATWSLTAPPASDPNLREESHVDLLYHFKPDVQAGQWTLEVTVSDPEGQEGSDSVTFCTDADSPPCLGVLSPEPAPAGNVMVIDRQAGLERLAVESVSDDLDPFPGSQGFDSGEAHFAWSMSQGGGPIQSLAQSGHELVLDPLALPAGTPITVRVDVLDRVPRATCAAAADTCESSPGCLQRRTWHLEVR